MKHHETVDRYEEWFTTSLLLDDDGSCIGCVAATSARARWRRPRQRSDPRLRRRRAVLQAHTNALICTADGMAQAYRVGAPLMDMEMIQYHPTTLVENGLLITEGARGEGAHL